MIALRAAESQDYRLSSILDKIYYNRTIKLFRVPRLLQVLATTRKHLPQKVVAIVAINKLHLQLVGVSGKTQ